MNLINPSCETFGRFASFGEHLAHDAEFYGGEGRRQEEEEEEEEGNERGMGWEGDRNLS